MPRLPFIRTAATIATLGAIALAGQASYSSSTATHVVRQGDTLWAISRADGVTVNQLAAANDMNPSAILSIGRVLTLPSASSSATTASLAEEASGGSAGAVTHSGSGFCATFSPAASPRGVLPYTLAVSPTRLALRPYFVEWAAHYGISPALVEAIGWQESGWQESAVSSADAQGVGQLLPATAQFVSTQLVGIPLSIGAASDNIRMSAAYLAYLQRRTGGNLCETIASYYEGPENLARYGVLTMSEPYVASVEALIPRFS